jgi:hypothetical protein
VLLAGLFALVSGCGSSGDGSEGVASVSGTSTPPSSAPGGGSGDDDTPDIDQMRAYAKCMREHGIDMADPDPDSGGGGISVGSESEKQKVDTANAACKHLMPNGGKPDKPTPEDLDKARATAKCLREHGVDVKEPTMEDPGISVDAGAGDAEKVNKAMEECAPKGARTQTNGGSR